ncbi:hypothetical protein BDQ17DRAFT_1437929 [Cyathus striatus]|nr:hypothetical protein BDQ17DRAFT_1437929 [Cyathus striatus]
MAEDNCALNHDGTLKDASEIQWHYNPDDEMPLPKNNKRARIEKMFLDIEARVASDSEGEEDGEDINRFINDEDQDEEDPKILQRSLYARLHNEDKKQQVMDCLCSGGGDLLVSLQAGQRIDNHCELINNIFTMYVNSSPSSYIGAVLQVSGTSSLAVSKHSVPQCGCNSRNWPLWDLVVKCLYTSSQITTSWAPTTIAYANQWARYVPPANMALRPLITSSSTARLITPLTSPLWTLLTLLVDKLGFKKQYHARCQ